MKRLFQVSAITCLLVVMASVAYAVTTIKSAKSNTSDRVVVSDSLTPAQAMAFLAEWDKMPVTSTTEAAVRGILEKKGPNAVNVKLARIIIRTDMKPPRVIVLANSMLEAEALAFSVPGTPSNQATTKQTQQSSFGEKFPAPGGSAFPTPQPGIAVSDPGTPSDKTPAKPTNK
jgi:hypothetical protein